MGDGTRTMARPRRVVTRTGDEVKLVFDLIFGQDSDYASQSAGLDRIAVWLARGSFPHAIESTAAVLHAILLDSSPSESSSKAARSHPARLTYAMALVRFVNSIVDPLQTAYFARPIAALAASVDLPLSFVELRHRATHEHLPSLAVLRDAARQAMDWLYTHYWLPLVAQGALDAAVVQGDEVARDATVLREQLGAYKALAKRLQRDASLVASHKDKRDKAMRTVVDAALALTAAPGDSVPVIDILLEPGMLVPLAKSKRPSSSRNKGKGKASTEPGLVSPELVEVWSPLLARLDDAVATPEQEDEDVPSFIDALVDRLASILCSAPDPQDDKSYFHTLAAWLVHFCCPTDGDDELALQVARACFESLNARTRYFLQLLAKVRPSLKPAINELLGIARDAEASLRMEMSDKMVDEKLEAMRERVQAIRAAIEQPSRSLAASGAYQEFDMGCGWQLVDEATWRPSPIGTVLGTATSADPRALDLPETTGLPVVTAA